MHNDTHGEVGTNCMRVKMRIYLRIPFSFLSAVLLALLLLCGIEVVKAQSHHPRLIRGWEGEISTQSDSGPILSIQDDIPAYAGNPVSVTVNFTGSGHAIASVAFSLDYDQACLDFDPSDADGDQIPDAVQLTLPGGFSGSVTFDEGDTEGELDFFVSDLFPPLAAIPDGSLATVIFTPTCQPAMDDTITATVGFSDDPIASFGDTDGQSIEGTTSDGSVEILPSGPSLSIPDNISAQTNEPISAPISFEGNGHSIATTAFSVDYDQACLDFDPADEDADGLPDDITFNISGAFNASVAFDASDTDGELDFFIGDIFPPLASLSDSVLVTVTFTPTCSLPPGSSVTATIGFSQDPVASFGDTDGQSVSGMTTDGYIEITSAPITPGIGLSSGCSHTLAPGSELIYTHILTNSGNYTDTFDLSVNSGWATLMSNSPITLGQELTRTIHVSVTVPSDAISGTVGTTIVTATSRTDTKIYAVVTDTTTVSEACTSVQSVEIDGPATVLSGTAVTLSATYTPTNASGVTLLWDNGSTGESTSYTWASEGEKTIVVTATGDCGHPVTDTYTVTVRTSKYHVYHPLVLRNH
jgi:hypothetical protein